jgi:hypothetical protein
MRKSPCHPAVNLFLRRMGKSRTHEIYLTSCPECGAKYQVTIDGAIYQTAKKRTDSKTERGSWRLDAPRLEAITSKWGSVQKYLDLGKI